ncbi:MAG: dihydroxyacetone kinase subunit DhaK [Planctomycetota bacterium]|nr:dihydroxyacetone kinase subunit DhaK [Planctomycetota bacterium]
MKKIINQANRVVPEMLEGFEATHSRLVRLLPEARAVLRRIPKSPGKVALISGGGSGHEPAHAGYVGFGMLDAAVAGNVFASPNPEQLLAALDELKNQAGILMIIKNYSGDVMNFGIAAEMAAEKGAIIEKVVVNDDVALAGRDKPDWRRGIAGTVFVHKIAGAAAEKGMRLAEVRELAERAVAGMGSMGVALSPCIVPEAGKPGFSLGENEMEIGLGIHGEAGARKTAVLPADEIAGELFARIRDDVGLKSGDKVAVLVNGLGGTPPLELYILARAARRLADQAGLNISYSLVGNYMTSLEMAGASLTLLRLDAELEELLAAPALTPAIYQPAPGQ